MERGLFITIEGVEGAGKTTNLAYIQQYLKPYAPRIVMTREPGGNEVAEAIRQVLLAKTLPDMHADTELLLMFAARAEHLRHKIEPALEQGVWVLCDRFTDSTYAYQGGGRGIDKQRIAQLENWVQGELRPDVTFYFDVDAETGLARTRSRGDSDRFEEQDLAFFNRIRDCFLQMAEAEPDRYRIIDASPDLEQVQQQLDGALNDVLQQRGLQ